MAVAVLGLIAGSLTLVSPAHAATPLEFVISSGSPDFGYVKQGNVVTQTITLLNSGDDDIAINPLGLGNVTTPFVVGNIDFSAATTVVHGAHVSFNIQYTAPAAGTNSVQPITLTAADLTHPGPVAILPITFAAKSIATEPADFTITPDAGTSTIDFGMPTVGTAATATVTLTNDGVLPLAFADGSITLQNSSGATLSEVTLTGSSFGTAGMVYQPGESATFQLTFAPTATAPIDGLVSIRGVNPNCVAVAALPADEHSQCFALEHMAIVGTAVAPTPTPTPTPTTPTTPAAVTPGTTNHAATVSSSHLASTGLATQGPLLIAAAATVLGLVALLLGIAYRRFARRAQR